LSKLSGKQKKSGTNSLTSEVSSVALLNASGKEINSLSGISNFPDYNSIAPFVNG
jgi:hypothetical protein